MFKDDIDLVHAMVEHYGLRLPFVDLGGLRAKDLTVADYRRTIQSGVQSDRYLHLTANPFEDLAPGYQIINPQYGQMPIEELPHRYPNYFGTIVCLSVLEHVRNPFEIFKALWAILQPGGLLILSTVQSFPIHDAPHDYWRFSDNCLRMLAASEQFEVLECGYRLNIHGGMGVLEIHTGVPQEIRSVYLAARK